MPRDPDDPRRGPSEDELTARIAAALEGDVAAQGALIEHCWPLVVGEVHRRLAGRMGDDVLDEVVQRSLVALYEGFGSFRGSTEDGRRANLRSFARGIARNLCLQELRPQTRRPRLLPDPTAVELVEDERHGQRSPMEGEDAYLDAQRLEQLRRHLRVEPWREGDEAHPILDEGALRCLAEHHLPRRGPAPASVDAHGGCACERLRRRAREAVADHESWAWFDPWEPDHWKEGNRLAGHLFVRLMPGSRFRPIPRCALSDSERRVWEGLWVEGLSVEVLCEKTGMSPGNVHQVKSQIRKRAQRALSAIDEQLGSSSPLRKPPLRRP